jgi:cytoskeleton protein RodZ
MDKKSDRHAERAGGGKGVGSVSAPDMRATASTDADGGCQLALPLSRGIHAMRAEEASEVNERRGEAAGAQGAAPMESYERAAAPVLGQRLAEAREQLGWTIADVAARLKLPVKLIARLESDDYAGLTQGVFLHGYLGSYARLVGIPVEQAASVAAAHSETAPLVATGTISRSRYLFERYSVSATYLVLTAIIVVPAVWLATHGGLEQNFARTTPLDPPAAVSAARETVPVATFAPSAGSIAAAPAGTAVTDAAAPAAMPAHEQAPVIASMAPFPSAQNGAPARVPGPAEGIGGTGAHVVTLKLAQESWVEISTPDGRKLEYGILAAGSDHSYRSDGPLSIRLGNAQGAELRTDGQAVDLAQFQRGNVAHLTLFGEGAGAARRADQ